MKHSNYSKSIITGGRNYAKIVVPLGTNIFKYRTEKVKFTKKKLIFSFFKRKIWKSLDTEMLHIGRNKAYELINTNVIESKRIGKKHIIPKIRVIEFLMNGN